MAARESIGQRQAQDDDETPKAPKQRSELVRIVIPGAIAIFIAVLGAQVAAPLLTQMIAGAPAATRGQAEEDVDPEEALEDEVINLASLAPAIYTPLDPPLVVSFAEQDGGTRFLQLTLQAMARSEQAIDGIKRHAPAIRNAFLFQLSALSVDDLMTLEGKEKLRTEMTAKAQEILEANTGKPGLEELYFTSFVIQ